jgi:FkbM family methyltransferase
MADSTPKEKINKRPSQLKLIMKKKIVKFLNGKFLNKHNFDIYRHRYVKKLDFRIAQIKALFNLPLKTQKKLLPFINQSKSQIYQDLFAIAETNCKKNGFFVEFGATNGIDISNTYLLERELNWKGILAEPAKKWHKNLKDNRKCTIETKCVWNKSDLEIEFYEGEVGELSTIGEFRYFDNHKRQNGETYKVKTISLFDLLKKHNAPNEIDYLSIDTEGSEYEILANFNFSTYNIKVITVEHNYTIMRERIYTLLTQNGYVRKYETLSLFDDWYVKQ